MVTPAPEVIAGLSPGMTVPVLPSRACHDPRRLTALLPGIRGPSLVPDSNDASVRPFDKPGPPHAQSGGLEMLIYSDSVHSRP